MEIILNKLRGENMDNRQSGVHKLAGNIAFIQSPNFSKPSVTRKQIGSFAYKV